MKRTNCSAGLCRGLPKRGLALLVALLLCLPLVSCSAFTEEVPGMKAEGDVHASFESKITLRSADPLTGEGAAVFKSTVTVEDIRLSGALNGKTVKSVTFIDESTLELVLDGKAPLPEGEDALGQITVLSKALENNYDAIALVDVRRAYMRASSAMTSSATATFMATYELSAGSFTDAAADASSFRLAEGCDGRIESVTLENGQLTVRVVGATQTPELIIDAAATSFNREVHILVRAAAQTYME